MVSSAAITSGKVGEMVAMSSDGAVIPIEESVLRSWLI